MRHGRTALCVGVFAPSARHAHRSNSAVVVASGRVSSLRASQALPPSHASARPVVSTDAVEFGSQQSISSGQRRSTHSLRLSSTPCFAASDEEVGEWPCVVWGRASALQASADRCGGAWRMALDGPTALVASVRNRQGIWLRQNSQARVQSRQRFGVLNFDMWRASVVGRICVIVFGTCPCRRQSRDSF